MLCMGTHEVIRASVAARVVRRVISESARLALCDAHFFLLRPAGLVHFLFPRLRLISWKHARFLLRYGIIIAVLVPLLQYVSHMRSTLPTFLHLTGYKGLAVHALPLSWYQLPRHNKGQDSAGTRTETCVLLHQHLIYLSRFQCIEESGALSIDIMH